MIRNRTCDDEDMMKIMVLIVEQKGHDYSDDDDEKRKEMMTTTTTTTYPISVKYLTKFKRYTEHEIIDNKNSLTDDNEKNLR